MIGVEVSDLPPEDTESLRAAVARLAEAAPKWQLLLHSAVYADTKAQIDAVRRASAKKRFNYP